jgi:tetratricopeptide (TPR) repeat protein
MSDKPPADKDELLELLKKLWLPVGGFIAAITLAYNFYKMWLGDQETVTYVIVGAGLLILIIALIWVGFRTKTVEIDSIIQNENQTVTKKKIKKPAYGSKYQSMALGALSFVLIGAVLAGYSIVERKGAERAGQLVQATQQAQATQIQATQNAQKIKQVTQTQQSLDTQNMQATQQASQTQKVLATQFAHATQQAQQELQAKLIVVIANFEGPEEVYGLRNEIVESLNSAFSQDEEVEIVTVNDVITPDMGSSYARATGERLMADLVIWGWYRPTENPNITVHIENLSPTEIVTLRESETYEPPATLEQLESFEIQRQLGSETGTLISFLMGTLKYKIQDYESAIERFEQVLATNDMTTLVNQYDLYFDLGYSNLELGNYEQAIQSFNKAIELNPKKSGCI